MNDIPPGIRRVCAAVGVEPRREGGERELESLRRQMAGAIVEACSSPGLERILLCRQSDGDVEIVVLPAGIDEPCIVAALVNGLIDVLRRINMPLNGGDRVRLRMAVHEGITMLTGSGFAGRAVAKACRMLSAPPLLAALARSPKSDFAVMLSDPVFEDIGSFDRSLPLDRFERVEISGAVAEFREVGWIFVPQ